MGGRECQPGISLAPLALLTVMLRLVVTAKLLRSTAHGVTTACQRPAPS